MNDVVQQILIGAAGDGSGGLAAEFVVALLRTAGKLVCERFGTPERTSALQRAVAAAFTEALDAWAINTNETVHYCDLFKNWLLNPTVLSEFRALLTPVDSGTLDIELLRAEFEDSGLSADYLGTVSFDVLLQDMVGAFYRAAAEEPTLQEPIKIDLLRQMAQRMGALDRLMQRQTRAGEIAVDHLAEIRRLAQERARGQDNTNTLLQQIQQVLTEMMQGGSASQKLVAYQQSELALTTAGLLSDADGSSATNGEREQALPALQSILTMLAQIHRQLTADGGRPSAETLAALEERYRQTLIDQFEHLTFEGLQPSGVPIVLPLEKVYVELKAVVDVPEAADTYSAEERRLLLEAEGRGSLAREEVAMHLDALRDAAYGALLRLATAPEQEPQEAA